MKKQPKSGALYRLQLLTHGLWLVGIVLPALLSAAQPTEGDWYQIEVIAFKRLDVAASQPTSTPILQPYPQSMVAIAPSINEPTQPRRIEQAMYLLAEGSHSQSVSAGTPVVARTEFRFAQLASGAKSRALLDAIKAQQSERLLSTSETDRAMSTRQAARSEALRALFQQPSMAFRSVANQDRMLEGPARSIRRSSQYRLMLHQSWTQPITGVETPILLQGGEQYGAAFELEGTLKLRKSRFLHVSTDLWFVRFNKTQMPEKDWGTHPLNADFPVLIKAAAKGETFSPGYRYHMTEQRRLRSNEAHYLDHPQFGLIVQIRPVEPKPI